MPSRNRVKYYLQNSYYHAYNRGVDKTRIFKDAEDYAVFLNLFKRYLSRENICNPKGKPYAKLHDVVELLAFCLMDSHYHILLYQVEEHGMTSLMRRTQTGYTRYFNNKYGRVGHLFQDIYKASRIDSDAYLWHVSKYIHLNPLDLDGVSRLHKPSSLQYYLMGESPDWINIDRVLDMHKSMNSSYLEFMETDHGASSFMKGLLADS